jgi:predicted secreted hydrolase
MKRGRALVRLALACAIGAVGAAPRIAVDPDGFHLAVPPWAFRFPLDHAAHPSFRTEWWYYTGHLRAGGRAFGYEATFFRMALPRTTPADGRSAWRAQDVIFRHLALTDEKGGRFHADDRAERQALDLAGADSTRYLVWLGDDYAGLEADGRTHRVVGHGSAFALDLRLEPEKPPVAHGENGVSQKSSGLGDASHYYSITRLATRGRLVLAGDTLAVDGRSWMDHEFMTHRMGDTHAGWDWFSIQLADGRDLMLYRLRLRSGGDEPLSSGTLVAADGRARHLPREAFEIRATGSWKSPQTGGVYPAGWVLRLPGEALELRLEPVLADQEIVAKSMNGLAYWEGRVRVTGRSAGAAVAGEGYVELTGYAGPPPGP